MFRRTVQTSGYCVQDIQRRATKTTQYISFSIKVLRSQ